MVMGAERNIGSKIHGFMQHALAAAAGVEYCMCV
jgi:hypothetical protein